MKKFLSLVLSLAMTLSLVTISASATDYDNLSDKGEIQYEEAVAVLNKLGIITGYEDGSFKPTGALTRGAAAKIIVSLMIGADAAANLSATAAPYKDVPVTNTFAAVISYCKTSHYIDGYTDGTFRPTAALSGSAFSKMLLGALGYDGSIEHFTGSGWTMNVAKLGQKAGLFNDFATAFKPNDTVDRESACLLALNTLKATEVEYTGSTVNVKTGDAQVTVGNTSYSYVTNNNSKINANIKGQDAGNNSAYLTLQFGEEHFTDLKLTADGTATDDFGRPSNQWSYKNVKIGTYALTPDYSYTTEADGDTKADKVKDMGLKDFKVSSSYYTVNGKDVPFTANTNAGKLEEIADLTANGVLVEAYLDDDNADTIESFVLVYTQVMKVNTVKSTEVTFKTVEDTYLGTSVKANYPNISSVTSVKDDDDAWTSVKDLKADDYVLIVPVKDGSSYRVFSAAAPQTATGSLSNIKVKTNNTTVNGITVAGTAYKMSKLWASEDGELTGSTKINSSTDTTVYLDAYGYAIYVKDVTASNSAIIIDEIYSSLSDGKIVKYAKGWDSNGNELSLNLGTNPTYPVGAGNDAAQQGKVYEYETSTSNSADYKLVANTTTLTQNKNVHVYAAASPANKYVLSGASTALIGSSQVPVHYDANVKFIFINADMKDDNVTIDDVTGITVNNGVTEVGSSTDTSKQYNLSYIVNKDGDKILAVIIPNDDDAANTANLLYFQKVTNHVNNADGKRVAMFTAYINGEKVTDCQLNKDVKDLTYNDSFFTYSKDESTGVYTLSKYIKTSKITSVYTKDSLTNGDILSDTYFKSSTHVNDGASFAELNAKNAQVIDLYTDDGVSYGTLKEMKDALNDNVVSGFTVSYIYNGSDNSGSGTVSYLFITDNTASTSPSGGDSGSGATLPSISNLPVAYANPLSPDPTVTGVNGRYVASEGKLYLQLLGLPAGAANVTVSGLYVTETTSGRVVYLDPITVNVQKGTQVSEVASIPYTANSAATMLTVNAGTATVHSWNVTYGASTLTLANKADATVNFTVAKPAGATEYKYTPTVCADLTIADKTSGTEYTATADVALTAKLTAAVTTCPTISVATTPTKVALTQTAPTSYGNGVLTVVKDTKPELNYNAASQTVDVDVVLNQATTSANILTVYYKVNGGAEVNKPTTGSTDSRYTVALPITQDETKGAVSVEITKVVLTKAIVTSTVAAGVSSAGNLGAAATVKVMNGNTEVTGDATEIAIGTVLTIEVTPASVSGSGVIFHFNGTDSAVVAADSTAKVTFSYTVVDGANTIPAVTVTDAPANP